MPLAPLLGAGHPRLKEAIEDSLILLDYLARRGDDIGHSTIDAIVNASKAYQDGRFNAGKESALWVALNQVSKAAAPATPETIRFSQNRAGEPPGQGASRKITHAVASKYRTVTFVFFVLFVISSAYWSAVTASLKSLDDAVAAAIPGADETVLQNATIDAATSMRSLQIFSFGIPYVLGSPKSASKFGQTTADKRFIRSFMKGVENAIYVFILPLVAGGLEASVYVVRLISKEIEREAFSPRFTIRFDLRIYLGSIAGLIICRLFLTEASSFVNTLTPIGIAFIVGYSIEVFFSFLGRIVGAFSTESRR